MIRVGGQHGGQRPDPDAERQLGNAMVIGNFVTFGLIIAGINALPYVMEAFGFDLIK